MVGLSINLHFNMQMGEGTLCHVFPTMKIIKSTGFLWLLFFITFDQLLLHFISHKKIKVVLVVDWCQ